MKKNLLFLPVLFFLFSISLIAQSFDDFENGDSTNQWGGIWEAFKDANAASSISFTVSNTTGYNSTYSLHATGQFASYGGVAGFLNIAKSAMNLEGKINGISFYAKGTGVPVRVRVRELKAESARGYAYFGKVFTPTSEWVLYTIPFTEMTPQYGDPVPPFDATDLYAIDFGPAATNQAMDVYVDNIVLNEVPLSGNYYIGEAGTGPGGSDPDFPSLDSAFKAINASEIGGDCTFFITSNLTETKNVALGKAVAPHTITFKPYTGTTDTITFTQTTDNTGASGAIVIGTPSILITSATNYGLVTTNNIIIDGSNIPGGDTRDLVIRTAAGINGNTVPIRMIGDVNDVTVKNVKVITGQAVSYAVALIVRFGNSENFVPDNITIDNCDITNIVGAAGQGIAISNSGTPTAFPTGIVFKNNLVTARTRGIFLNNAGSTDVFNNEIHVNQTDPGYTSYGIWGYTIGDTSAVQNIFNNRITLLSTANNSAGDYGIIGIEAGSKGTYNIYNNMISGFTPTTAALNPNTRLLGIRVQAAAVKANIYHNTIYMPDVPVVPGAGTILYSGLYLSNGVVDLKNNIVVNDEKDFPAFCLYRAGTAGSITSDFNNLYPSDALVGKAAFNNGDTLSTLAEWRSASSSDEHSVSHAVNFVSADDLHLTGASVGDKVLAGTPIAAVTEDIDGDLRNASSPYMGADEGSIVIPVELTSFSAAVNGKNVELNWTTATETNNRGFELERKSNNSWEKIGFIAGTGTTSELQRYSFVDSDVPSGKLSYRLKQIDFDGTFSYSNVVEVEIVTVTNFELLQNYPNPFNPNTDISFMIPVDAKVKLEIYSVTGELVEVLANEFLSAGKHVYRFNASGYASGTYIYRLTSDNVVLSKKMILMK